MRRVYDVSVARRRDLQSEIEELFSDLWQVPRFTGLRQGFRPRVDCYSTDAEITVIVELPGVDPARVRLDATPRTLSVSGERKRTRAPGAVYQVMETDHGPFQRVVHFAEDVDVARVTASYRDGLLTIVLPIAERSPTGPVNVPIEVETDS
jgi:HSP20 family protein